jgi:hypothetical protein
MKPYSPSSAQRPAMSPSLSFEKSTETLPLHFSVNVLYVSVFEA